MGKEAKAKGDRTTEELAEKGAAFDIESEDGTFRIILQPLEPDEGSAPEQR
jgi:hypothetical protein